MKRLLKHQRQRFYSNCGPTCVAMLARMTQTQACRAMFGEVFTRGCYSQWKDIRRGLKRLGLTFGTRAHFVSKWDSIRETAIVGCSRQADGNWHWVVYSPKERLIYDPDRRRPLPVERTRRKPFSYLTVRPRRVRP